MLTPNLDELHNLEGEINALKQFLSITDYKALKFAEGEITEEDYAIVQLKRRAWRKTINEHETRIEEILHKAQREQGIYSY